ncbi:hypothetical protein JB92DRAFT_2885752 [Gautieria morchelliformis]|nr:hypothetical protein JB92DRAFT_2885752 [Gautieria morchelliformis]
MTTEPSKPAPAGEGVASAEVTIEESLEQAKRAYAIQNFEQAVEHYATALELMTNKHGDASPACVDIYFAYGKALLENAIAQNSVLGKEETSAALQGDDDGTKASGSGLNASDARIHFGEDAIFENDNKVLEIRETDREEQTVDLFAEATNMLAEDHDDDENAESGDDEEGDGEPEDDFNAAWEVLEVARSLYEAQTNSDDEAKLKLADTYIALGDVSLETEKLEQAVSDYNAAVTLKSNLLPLSSRQIAEVHYKLCIVYDMTAGRLAHAIEHARKAEASVQARLDEITSRLKTVSTMNSAEVKVDLKGKGKATSNRIGAELSLDELSEAQLEVEVKELQQLLEDVSLKIEELKSSPDIAESSVPDLVAHELDRDLNGAATNPSSNQVNDLTSMVVRRKKKTSASTAEKRKADDGEIAGSPEKKIKAD